MKPKSKEKDSLNFNKVWTMFQASNREFDQIIKENNRWLKEFSIKTDLSIQETKRIQQETAKELKELGKMVGGVSNNMGDAAEDFFYNGLSSTMQIGNIKYDIIERNIRRKVCGKEGEFDTLLINSKTVVVVEVKYKTHPKLVNEMTREIIPLFKGLYPEYKGYKIYGAVAGFTVPQDTLKLAQQNGLYVLTQKGDNITLINDRGFTPLSF